MAPEDKQGNAYPNTLRERREAKLLTRPALSELCKELALTSPALFAAIGTTTIRDLESGTTRPRLKTVATLARVLEVDPNELFPSGFDDPRRNPTGKTDVTDRHISRNKR